MNKPAVVVVVSALLWGLLWIRPFWVIPVGVGACVCLCGMVLYGAVRHRRRGWTSGVLFALLLLGLPLWIGVLLRLYEQR